MHAKKYPIVFTNSVSKSSVTIFNTEFIKNELCVEAINNIEIDKIHSVILNRDSSVLIFFNVIRGLKNEQYGLLYVANENNLDSVFNLKIDRIESKGNGWFVFKRSLSLAD